MTLLPVGQAAAVENGRIAYEDYVEYDDENGLPKFARSPDGTRLAFASNRDGNLDLYTMAPDGSDVQQVTFTYGIEYEGGYVDYFTSWEPTWSPDGTQVAYTGYRVNPYSFEIHVAAIGQTEESYVERLVTDSTDFQNSSQPDWSPVGDVLLYTQYFDYYTTDSGGSGSTARGRPTSRPASPAT